MGTYVYNGDEVKKTGRIAKKEPGKDIQLIRGRRRLQPTEQLVEICPVDNPDAWKTWVKESELYVVVEDETKHHEDVEVSHQRPE